MVDRSESAFRAKDREIDVSLKHFWRGRSRFILAKNGLFRQWRVRSCCDPRGGAIGTGGGSAAFAFDPESTFLKGFHNRVALVALDLKGVPLDRAPGSAVAL